MQTGHYDITIYDDVNMSKLTILMMHTDIVPDIRMIT